MNDVDFHAKAQANRERAGYADIPDDLLAVFARCAPFTMTTVERMFALHEACVYAVRAGIHGAVVETGVWRGGSLMVAALALQAAGSLREIWAYDTFSGLPKPAADERDIWGASQLEGWLGYVADGRYEGYRASEAEVRANIASTEFPMAQLRCIEGLVEETIPEQAPEQIAVLRLDTDWHASTAHALEHLYPRLVSGGALILDDYGHLSGARKAVDEYFAAIKRPPLLVRVDYSCRVAVKP